MSFSEKLDQSQDKHRYLLQLEETDELPARLVVIDVSPRKLDIFQKHLKNPQSQFNLTDYGKVLEIVVGKVSETMLEEIKVKYQAENSSI